MPTKNEAKSVPVNTIKANGHKFTAKDAIEASRPGKVHEVEAVPATVLPAIIENQVVVPQDFKTKLTRKQIDTIKEQFAKDASDVELQMFLYVCQRTGLDPFSKQVHLVPRWDSRLGKEVRSVIVGIDGLRSTAERTGAYAGNTDPIFGEDMTIEVVKKDYKTKKEAVTKVTVPSKATVTVKKVVQGVICDFTATAKWSEYYPGDRQGMMWQKMPENMLGKCAEAKALRKAFPAVMGGLYVAEEMQQAVATAAPETSGSYYDKASQMISKITDAVALGDVQDKIAGSKKYTAEEKKNLKALIEGRIKEINLEATQEKAQADADTEKKENEKGAEEN